MDPQTGAHELIFTGYRNMGVVLSPFGDIYYVYNFCDISTTMADVDTNFLFL